MDKGLWLAEHGSRETGSGQAGGLGRHDERWDWDNSCHGVGRVWILDRVSRERQRELHMGV